MRKLFLILFVLVSMLLATGVVSADPPEFVTICHAAGLAEGPANWVTLTLPYQAVFGQAGHFYENGTPQAGHEQDYLGPCQDEGDDDDDDEMCPWNPQLPIDSDLCVPPGDDDDDDEVEYCPYNRQLPLDSPECVPPGDDDDDDGGPTPKCGCYDGVYGCYMPGTEPQTDNVYFDVYDQNGNKQSVTEATCLAPPPAPPSEPETGLTDDFRNALRALLWWRF